MIRLVSDTPQALRLITSLNVTKAAKMAAQMFVEGFGVSEDFLQVFSACDDSQELCAVFVVCNDRLFCLIEKAYDADELRLFLRGFTDYKILISSEHSHLVNRDKYEYSALMNRSSDCTEPAFSENITEPDSKLLSQVMMSHKDKDFKIRFFLNNSHLVRHGFVRNFAYTCDDEVMSVASLYFQGNSSYLCNVFTPEIHRNNGYCLKLLSEILSVTKDCYLICRESLCGLYEKCGFNVCEKWVEFLY